VEVDSVVEQISSFGIAAAVAFQSVFRLEMHQNNIFFIFFKFIFDINTSKQSKNTKKNNFKQKKIKFWANSVLAAMPNTLDGMGGPP
jgi:hypothetical protein